MKNFGSTNGLTILAEDQATPAKGMVNYITSSYQSGWQNGDIKGAFLSDTDDTDLVYAALNSTTDYTSEWVQTEDGWTINATSLVCDGLDNAEYAYVGSISGSLYGEIAIGDQISVKLTISGYVGGTLKLDIGTGVNNTILTVTADGDYAAVGTLTDNGRVYIRSENFEGTVENLEISKPDPDRSVNG